MSSSKTKNELQNLQEKYKLLQQDHAIAVLHKLSALEELEKCKLQLAMVSEELINVSVQLEKSVNEKQDCFDDISKLQEAVVKELEVEAKKAATTTTQEQILLGGGAQNRTTGKDMDETDAPLSHVSPAEVEQDETDSDDERAIIAFHQKKKRAI